jgi:hypothetical protein
LLKRAVRPLVRGWLTNSTARPAKRSPLISLFGACWTEVLAPRECRVLHGLVIRNGVEGSYPRLSRSGRTFSGVNRRWDRSWHLRRRSASPGEDHMVGNTIVDLELPTRLERPAWSIDRPGLRRDSRTASRMNSSHLRLAHRCAQNSSAYRGGASHAV